MYHLETAHPHAGMDTLLLTGNKKNTGSHRDPFHFPSQRLLLSKKNSSMHHPCFPALYNLQRVLNNLTLDAPPQHNVAIANKDTLYCGYDLIH
jgi:hypothetical protein